MVEQLSPQRHAGDARDVVLGGRDHRVRHPPFRAGDDGVFDIE
jgi:hypothetical protein